MENNTPKKKQLPAYLMLAIIALVAAVVLAVTNMVTSGPIQEHAMAALKEAFGAVMPADSYEEITVPAGYDVSSLYAAKTGDNVVGYCVTAVGKGYNGDVAVTLGVGTDGLVTGCAVGDTSFAETAGFGARAKEATFQDQFVGLDAVNGGSFEALSGATITSTAVLNATNAALKCVDEVALNKTAAADPLVVFGAKQETTAPQAELTGEVRQGSAKGFASDVTVKLTLDENGAISGLDIDATGETEGFGQRTMTDEAFQAQFVGQAGPFTLGENVDALSGATVTSTAVVDAVNAALSAPASAAGDTLTGTAKGFQSDVTVTLTMDGDTISAITVDSTGETEGFGQRATTDEAFLAQFAGKTAPLTLGGNIDALSGATVTSTAVVDAANQALSSASGTEEAPATVVAEDDNAKVGVKADGSATVQTASSFTGTVDAVLTVEGGKVTGATVASKLPSTAEKTEDGAFTATAKGFQSNVRATLTLNADGTIATLSLGTSKETEYLGQEVANNKDFKAQFEGKAGPFTLGEGIDAVSGATVTSTAIVAAVNDAYAFALANGGTEAAEAAEATAEETPGDVLTGSAPGKLSDVTVTVTLDDAGAIATLTIDAKGETAGIGQRTMTDEAFLQQFIGKTAPFTLGGNVDALSGATVTSTAVVNALNALLSPATATDLPAANTLTGTAKGFESDVTVTVTLDATGAIAALTIDAKGETAGVGQRTMTDEAFQSQFIGKTAPFTLGENVDALSGATVTSTAVVTALNDMMAD